MKNNFTQNQINLNKKTDLTQNIQKQQPYSHSFICACQQSFTTFQALKSHILVRHPQIQKESQIQVQKQQGQILFLEENINNIQKPSQKDLPLLQAHLSQNEEENEIQNEQNLSHFTSQHQLHSISQHSQHSQPNQKYNEHQQNHLYFSYFQSYYLQKMSPFYKAFNINPYIKSLPLKQKFNRQQYYQKKRTISEQMQQKTAIQDYTKVQEELNLKMLPVINGILDFVEEIKYKKMHALSAINIQTKQMISQSLGQSLNKLYSLTVFAKAHSKNETQKYQHQSNNNDQDFMESDICFALTSFLDFLLSILGTQNVYLTESIILVFINNVLEMYTKQYIKQPLKTNDIPLCLINLPSYMRKTVSHLTNFIELEYINRIMAFLTQWTMIKQYMYNKFNRQYITEAQEMINNINQLYKKNVESYSKCISQRKYTNFKKSYKIFKERKSYQKSDLKNLQKQRKFNLQKQLSQPNKTLIFQNHLVNQQSLYPFKNQIINEPISRISPVYPQQKVKEKSFIKNIGPSLEIGGQYMAQKVLQDKESFRDKYQQKYKNRQPSYEFNQSLLELKKKQKQMWKQRIDSIKYLAQHPESFKSNMKQRIQEQLKEIDDIFCLSRQNHIQKNHKDPFIIKKNHRRRHDLFNNGSMSMSISDFNNHINNHYINGYMNNNESNMDNEFDEKRSSFLHINNQDSQQNMSQVKIQYNERQC